MSAVIDRLQAMALQPGWSRRRFLGQAVKASAAVAAAAAGLSTQGTQALAWVWNCCRFEYANWCNTGGTHECPCCSSCLRKYTWNCVDSVACAVYACVECYDCACSFGYKSCSCC